MNIKEELRKFKPKVNVAFLEDVVGWGYFSNKEIEDVVVFNLVKQITETAIPSSEDEFEKIWDFHIPMKRDGRFISFPFWISDYMGRYTLSFKHYGSLIVKKGIEKEEGLETLFNEVLRFIPLLKQDKRFLERTLPYDIRRGKIKSKYVLDDLMSQDERERIMQVHDEHVAKGLEVSAISLADYLETAAICYRAIKLEASELNPFEMYKRWADGRYGGMLDVGLGSKEEFMSWRNSDQWRGTHPFEIIFNGLCLYPPSDHSSLYSVGVSEFDTSGNNVKVFEALMANEVPVKVGGIAEIVEFLSGDIYFNVNQGIEPGFDYIPSMEFKRKYFHHVEWDPVEVPNWK